ncbi:hypothetical protein HZQ19_01255 [Elizabethkingia anophelis]|uniref:hypothetical protein n=1 Tax=Elizabethkingia anophelis TaxID=1117645 RepID=UPI000C9C0A28|nr:hypothetical protein [Elizabethkingia anophelis]MCT3758327.1 hypothetical protein [Elizabethkingia anophelis]MCT3972025.1 hypothetical protein [Elizabethkingia anophelis]MCT4000502.1 hypothetical protein [Elizabethkingia anophelis]MCT4014517.1 hypothetical protein [Elizabethkingia anophelis]MCT4018078.1 hypothetical protein [Elizabethkingia anophelis]
MENIKGTKLTKLPFELNKRGDLIAFEAPLLSHFYDENGKNYLLNWLDSNDIVNRWLLFEIQQIDLFDYFSQKKSLRNLIKESEEIVYFIDIDDNINYNQIILSNKNDIPNNYLPEKDSFFEEFIATKYANSLKNETIEIYNKYDLRNIKGKVKHFNSHMHDVYFMSTLNQRKINTSFKEVFQLKSSYLPLVILNHYLGDSHNEGLKHLISKHNLAYTNPFEYDSYFIELEHVLASITISSLHQNSHPQFLTHNHKTVDRLYSMVIGLISQNPKKYKKEIILWKDSLEEDEVNQPLDDILTGILSEE